jgi:hypothetical protein
MAGLTGCTERSPSGIRRGRTARGAEHPGAGQIPCSDHRMDARCHAAPGYPIRVRAANARPHTARRARRLRRVSLARPASRAHGSACQSMLQRTKGEPCGPRPRTRMAVRRPRRPSVAPPSRQRGSSPRRSAWSAHDDGPHDDGRSRCIREGAHKQSVAFFLLHGFDDAPPALVSSDIGTGTFTSRAAARSSERDARLGV